MTYAANAHAKNKMLFLDYLHPLNTDENTVCIGMGVFEKI